jgi:hypothetical protein
MKEFEFNFDGLNLGLVPYLHRPRNHKGLLECQNVMPMEEGLEIHEVFTDLNGDDVSWGGLGILTIPTFTRSVTINVSDYVGGANLQTVSVYIDGDLKGTTDANGNITVSGVAVGVHTLKLTKSGYQDSDEDNLAYNDILVVT